MEIRINLLPQTYSTKEKSSVFLIPILGITMVLVTASLLTYSYFDKKNSVQSLSDGIAAQTTTRNELLNEYQQKTAGVNVFNFTDQYKTMNDVLDSTYIIASESHKQLKNLLPEKAKVIGYTYGNNGEITMTVNSYSKGDSAMYLNTLLKVPFVDEAQLVTITVDEETFTYDSTYQIKVDTLVGASQ